MVFEILHIIIKTQEFEKVLQDRYDFLVYKNFASQHAQD